MFGAGVGGADGGVEAVGGGFEGDAGLLHLLGGGGRGGRVVRVGGWAACGLAGVGAAAGLGCGAAAVALRRRARSWRRLGWLASREVGVGAGFAFGGVAAAVGDDEGKRFVGHVGLDSGGRKSGRGGGGCDAARVLDAGGWGAVEDFAADVAQSQLAGAGGRGWRRRW